MTGHRPGMAERKHKTNQPRSCETLADVEMGPGELESITYPDSLAVFPGSGFRCESLAVDVADVVFV